MNTHILLNTNNQVVEAITLTKEDAIKVMFELELENLVEAYSKTIDTAWTKYYRRLFVLLENEKWIKAYNLYHKEDLCCNYNTSEYMIVQSYLYKKVKFKVSKNYLSKLEVFK